ncbi:MAG: Holliday junction resolvase RuvX [Chloroflexota bacterium]|nr:Holliday junction resolvase RuvX [Chloroflexota bacterium]MDQ6909077.1 Holliday junction resolvase RuvX [Chloroflexota bacterium]
MSAERLIGLDVGTHRIGVAVSDELQIIASPETTILVAQRDEGTDEAIRAIVALVRRYEARRVVVGLPRNMKGERGVQALGTEQFVARLRAALEPLKVYVSVIDERLTTAQATRTFQEERGRSRGVRREKQGRTTLDARAAALILQGYLDRRRNRRDALDVPGEET